MTRRTAARFRFLAPAAGLAVVFLVPAAGVEGRPVVEVLSLDMTAERVLVYLKTTTPVPRYVLRMPPARGDSRAVVLEFPDAGSALESAYEVNSPLLAAVRVEPGAAGGAGLRLHFDLGDAAFAGLEQVDRGLLLRFESAALRDGTFAPGGAPEYEVGVADKVEISVFGQNDLSRILEVRSDGTINLPLIGDVTVAGKTVAQIDTEITATLGRDFLVDPQVSVEVREYHSRWVTILGAVRSPSRYILNRDMHLIDLLAAAGGLTAEAGPEILITRRDGVGDNVRQFGVEVGRLYGRDNAGANVALRAGDIVTIGEREVFYIRGEVNRPGPYVVTKGVTLLRAIGVAGGMSQFANRKNVEVLRPKENGRHERIVVNLKAIEAGKKPDVPLRADDTIIVSRRIF